MITFKVETEREDDGRWLAEVVELPGVLAYGDTQEAARSRVQAPELTRTRPVPIVREDRGGAMLSPRERYVVDEDGNRVGVLLDIEEYRRLLQEAEELESIRAYDAAKASGDTAIPFEQAVQASQRDLRTSP